MIILDAGRARVLHPTRGTVDVELPLTRPLPDLLDAIDSQLGRAQDKPWSVDVLMTRRLCPSIAVSIPQGLDSVDQVVRLAQATAASTLGVGGLGAASAFRCALPVKWTAGVPTVCASMADATYELLVDWGKRNRGQLRSMHPLWSLSQRQLSTMGASLDASWLDKEALQSAADGPISNGRLIDLLKPARSARQARWVSGVTLVFLAACSVWNIHVWQGVSRTAAEILALEASQEVLRTDAQPPQALLAPVQMPLLDWNLIYGPLEGLNFPQVRVTALYLDVASSTARISIVLPDESLVLAVADALNAGSARVRWQLESLQRTPSSQGANELQSEWSAQLL